MKNSFDGWVFFIDGTEEYFEEVVVSELGIDAYRYKEYSDDCVYFFIPWSSIKKIRFGDE